MRPEPLSHTTGFSLRSFFGNMRLGSSDETPSPSAAALRYPPVSTTAQPVEPGVRTTTGLPSSSLYYDMPPQSLSGTSASREAAVPAKSLFHFSLGSNVRSAIESELPDRSSAQRHDDQVELFTEGRSGAQQETMEVQENPVTQNALAYKAHEANQQEIAALHSTIAQMETAHTKMSEQVRLNVGACEQLKTENNKLRQKVEAYRNGEQTALYNLESLHTQLANSHQVEQSQLLQKDSAIQLISKENDELRINMENLSSQLRIKLEKIEELEELHRNLQASLQNVTERYKTTQRALTSQMETKQQLRSPHLTNSFRNVTATIENGSVSVSELVNNNAQDSNQLAIAEVMKMSMLAQIDSALARRKDCSTATVAQ